MRHGAEILPQKQNSEIRDQEAGRLEQLGQGNLRCGGSFGKLVLRNGSRGCGALRTWLALGVKELFGDFRSSHSLKLSLADGDRIAVGCFESLSGESFLVKPMNLHFSMYGSDIQP